MSCDVNSLHHVTSITPNKMADNDMSFRQRAVIEFLIKEEILLQKFTRDFSMLMEVCMGVSSVRRWVNHFKDGNTNIQDQPRSGRPRTASTEHNKERVDEIIQDDRLVTVGTDYHLFGFVKDQLRGQRRQFRKQCVSVFGWLERKFTNGEF